MVVGVCLTLPWTLGQVGQQVNVRGRRWCKFQILVFSDFRHASPTLIQVGGSKCLLLSPLSGYTANVLVHMLVPVGS